MTATFLGFLAVGIALMALYHVAHAAPVIHIHMPEALPENSSGPQLPWFVDETAKEQLSELTQTRYGGH